MRLFPLLLTLEFESMFKKWFKMQSVVIVSDMNLQIFSFASD